MCEDNVCNNITAVAHYKCAICLFAIALFSREPWLESVGVCSIRAQSNQTCLLTAQPLGRATTLQSKRPQGVPLELVAQHLVQPKDSAARSPAHGLPLCR
jgi:hypothetical protein